MIKIAEVVKLKSGDANFVQLKSAFKNTQEEGLGIDATCPP
jgi:hypothetical protein